ncbi:MAG: HAMP domain-containing sensor histidine kinase [Thalassospira sp.]|uniref:sensor histidine kinase n=1 Tax=Thalassospira sp. TaxID=1912094 RepID=UPI0032ED868B
MFGVELDIRTLAFIATMSAVVQAIAFISLSLVARRGVCTTLWAFGGISNAIGFVLLGFRGVIPDIASVIVANTLITLAHGFYWLGLEIYTNRKPSYLITGIITGIVAILFVYYSEVIPSVSTRIIVISAALAGFSLICFYILWFQKQGRRTAPETVMALTFAVHGLYHVFRAAYTWLAHQEIANFMTASTIHMVAFLDVILFLLLTAVGFTGMIIISLNTSLRAEAKARNRLFAVLAHDLRTPFHGLSGLSLLAQQDLVAGNQAQALGNIRQLHSSTSETLRFLDDLLVWGRTLFDEGKPSRTEIDIDQLIKDTIATVRPLLEAKSITVTYSPHNLAGYGVAPHVQMICRNLLVNAIKFSNPRSRILIEAAVVGPAIHIRIIDRGAGVSDKMIAEFTKGTTSYKSTEGTFGEIGSGVGLSLCRDLCREDEEHLWLEHNPEGGLIATFSLSAEIPENAA